MAGAARWASTSERSWCKWRQCSSVSPTSRTVGCSTYARYRIRHGIRHTEALARRHHRPYVPNERLRYMRIGYARVSKADGSQSLDLQREALRAEGIDDPANLYHDFASGGRDDRPGLDSCVRALSKGDVLVVWKLGRLGRPRAHLARVAADRAALTRARRATAPGAPGPPAARWSASGRSAAGASRWRLSYAPSHRPCRRRYCLPPTRPPP